MWTWLKRVIPSEHEWAAQQLSAYLDSELSSPDQARVEAHLQECPTCAEELRTLRWTVNLTAQMPMLKAPRSFLITEAVVQPRRAPLSMAYVYLRGAAVAVAALLLVVLASDFLLPYALAPRMPAPQIAMRQVLPAVEEVHVEREVERAAPPVAPAPWEAKAAAKLPVATLAPEKEAAEKLEQEPMILMAPPAERAPDRALGLRGGEAATEQEIPVEKKPVASTLVTPTPTSAQIIPTPTPLPLRCILEAEVAPSPQPTPLPPAAAVAEVTEPAAHPFPPWRSALRFTEVGLGLLMILLGGSTLILRARHG